MKKTFHLNGISIIDVVAMNDYFLSIFELKKRGLIKNDNSKYRIGNIRDMRRAYFLYMVKTEGYKNAARKVKNEFILNLKFFPFDFIELFLDLVKTNAIQVSHYLTTGNDNIYRYYITFSLMQSKILFLVNIFSCLLFVFFIKTYPMLNFLLFSLILFNYISSGISLGQGDRFLIPIYFISIIWFFLNIIEVKKYFQKNNYLYLQ